MSFGSLDIAPLGDNNRSLSELPALDVEALATRGEVTTIQGGTITNGSIDVSGPKIGINPKDAVAGKKPDISLVPAAGILHEAMAMMDGAKKYGPYNWRDNAVLARVYIAAAMRHLQQLNDGEDFDPISLVHHAGHVRACMGIYLDAMEMGQLKDDRPKPGNAGDMIRKFETQKDFRPK